MTFSPNEPGSSAIPHAHGDTPLSHELLVLDFSHYLSASTCTMTLAVLGANVIKIERAGRGDDMRKLGPVPGQGSPGFNWANRNKRAIALDLRSPVGLEVALSLVDRADVLVENYMTGAMDRLGLGVDALLARNPRLVYCSISAYGREGPFAQRAGFDPVVQAESGLISLNGPAGTVGTRTGTPVVDLTAGFLACNAVLAGLLARERSGKGQHVELSLFDCAVTLAGLPIMSFLANGTVPGTTGNTSRESAPTDVYATADGGLYIACPSQGLFERLAVEVLDAPQLLEDPRFATNAQRMVHACDLRVALESILKQNTRRYWAQHMHRVGIAAGMLNTIAEAVNSDEMRSRGLVQWMSGPGDTRFAALELPYRFGATPVAAPARAPDFNEHAVEVLVELLALSPEQVNALKRAGAFGQ